MTRSSCMWSFLILHILTFPISFPFFQLVNNGPSRISQTLLELRCPLSIQSHNLLYPLEFSTEGPINCTADKNMNYLHLKVSDSSAHRCIPLRAKWGRIRMRRSSTDSHSDVWLTVGSSRTLANTHLLLPSSQPHPGHLPHHHHFEVPALPYAQHSLMNYLTQQYTHSSSTSCDTPPNPPSLYQVIALGFCGQNISVQLFVFTFEAWQMFSRALSGHLS